MVISIGSPDGEGADIFMVGVGVGAVMMGIVRAPILSSVLLIGLFRGALSVATSIWSEDKINQISQVKREQSTIETSYK